jgi:hypothetical protein
MTQRPSNANDIPIQVLAPPTHQGSRILPTPPPSTIKHEPQLDGSLEPSKTEQNESQENERSRFPTGVKLYCDVAGLMLVGFLVLLNGSFVATVRLDFCIDFLLHSLICLDLSFVDGSGASTEAAF